VQAERQRADGEDDRANIGLCDGAGDGTGADSTGEGATTAELPRAEPLGGGCGIGGCATDDDHAAPMFEKAPR
jgi:hypothetical protein